MKQTYLIFGVMFTVVGLSNDIQVLAVMGMTFLILSLAMKEKD